MPTIKSNVSAEPNRTGQRHYSVFDRLVGQLDTALRTLAPQSVQEERPSPAKAHTEAELTPTQRQHVAGLMRINHTGEVCAQALYQGQALTAKLPEVRATMEQAADEEIDHLAWCEQRVNELGSHTSYLNPLWYSLSFTVGAVAGAFGDKWSLGFVAETEQQVCEHLNSHLYELPFKDQKTQAILLQMNQDEAHHRQSALEAGGADLPRGVKVAMTLMSKVMTKTAYKV